MAERELQGVRVAIIVENGFEHAEMTEPRKALDEAGAETVLISPVNGSVRSWKMTKWGEEFEVDAQLEGANPDDYSALLLPGGVISADKLRANPEAVEFVKSFVEGDKPVAVICHAPWMLVEAGKAEGRQLTSWPSLKTDLENAGAEWVDEQVVRDGNLVTSRKPDDIPAFNKEMISMFAENSGQKVKASTSNPGAENEEEEG